MNNPFIKILSESYRLSPSINEVEETPEQQRIRLDAKQKAKEYIEKILKTKQQKDFLDTLAKKELEKYASEEPGDYNIEEAEEAKPDFSKMTDAEKAEYVRKKYGREIPMPAHQPTSLPKPPEEKYVGKKERPRDELGYLDEPERPLPPPKDEALKEYFYYYYGKPKPEGEPEKSKVSTFSTMTPQEKYDLVAKLQMIKYGKVYAKPPAGTKPHKVDEDTFHFPASGHFPSETDIDVKSMGKRIELPEPGGHTTTFFHKEFEKEHPEIPKHPKAKTTGTGSPYAWAAGAYDQPTPKTKTGTSMEEINETDQPRPSNDMSVPTNPDFASGTAPVEEEKIKTLGVDREQLKMGIKAELKDGHTTDPLIAAKIAMDHLVNEDPKYYTKLNKAGLEEVTGTATYPNPPPPKKYTYTKQAQVGPYPDYSTKVNVKGGDYAKEVKPFIDPTQTKSSKIEEINKLDLKTKRVLLKKLKKAKQEMKEFVEAESDGVYDLDEPETWEPPKKSVAPKYKGKTSPKTDSEKPQKVKVYDLDEPEKIDEMTYKSLYGSTDVKRRSRAGNVRTKSNPITTDDRDREKWNFSYKSSPSTTGRRWHGNITFMREQEGEKDIVAYCDCPDYHFRHAHANAVHGASMYDPGDAPHTNPTDRPGLCKHLASLKKYLEEGDGTLEEKLNKLGGQKNVVIGEMIINKNYPQSSLDLGWVNVEETTYPPMPSFQSKPSGKRIGRKTYYPKIEGVLNTEHHGQRIILGKIIQSQPFRVQEILKKFSKVFLTKNVEAKKLVREMKHASTDTERLIAEAKLVMLLKNELDNE